MRILLVSVVLVLGTNSEAAGQPAAAATPAAPMPAARAAAEARTTTMPAVAPKALPAASQPTGAPEPARKTGTTPRPKTGTPPIAAPGAPAERLKPEAGPAERGEPAASEAESPLPRDLESQVELFRRGPLSVRMGALLQVQGAFYTGNEVARQLGDAVDTEGFRIRRMRLSFGGELVGDFSYYVALDLKDAIGGAAGYGDRGNELLDARILWSRCACLGIAAGVDRVPFSAFSLESSSRLSLIERPLSSELLAPDRRVGLTVMGALGHFNYALGFFNGSEGATTGNQLAGVAVAGRLAFTLFARPLSFVPRAFEARLGLGMMYDNQAAVDVLRASASLDLSGYRVRWLSEFLWERTTPDAQPDQPSASGAVNRWAAISELSVFVWRELFQLALRYEYINDNEELPTFGRQQVLSGALNIYLHRQNLKLQLGYQRRDELVGAEVANDIGLAQLQAMF